MSEKPESTNEVVEVEEQEEALTPAPPTKPTLTVEIRDELREKYGQGNMQVTFVSDAQFVYRKMSRAEYEALVESQGTQQITPEMWETEVVKAMLVWPEYDSVDWSSIPGAPSTISNDILLFAGFGHKVEPITI